MENSAEQAKNHASAQVKGSQITHHHLKLKLTLPVMTELPSNTQNTDNAANDTAQELLIKLRQKQGHVVGKFPAFLVVGYGLIM